MGDDGLAEVGQITIHRRRDEREFSERRVRVGWHEAVLEAQLLERSHEQLQEELRRSHLELEQRVNDRTRELDLRPSVREQWLLAVPSFVLCREDCKGLCPHCGADLNLGPCGCTA